MRRALLATLVGMTAALTSFVAAPVSNAAPLIQVSPGSYLSIEHSNGKRSKCTAGPMVSLPRSTGRFYALLTAGHCGNHGDTVLIEIRGNMHKIGQLTDPVDTEIGGVHQDFGLLLLPEEVLSPVVAGKYRPSTYLSAHELSPGINLCTYGITSGERCGPVVSSNPRTGVIRADFESAGGDSGGPVYLKNRNGSIKHVGILRGHKTDGTNDSVVVSIDMPLNYYPGIKVITMG